MLRLKRQCVKTSVYFAQARAETIAASRKDGVRAFRNTPEWSRRRLHSTGSRLAGHSNESTGAPISYVKFMGFSAILVGVVGGIKYFDVAADWRKEQREKFFVEVKDFENTTTPEERKKNMPSWTVMGFVMVSGVAIGITLGRLLAPQIRGRTLKSDPAVNAVVSYLEKRGLRVKAPSNVDGSFHKNGATMSFNAESAEHGAIKVSANALRDSQKDEWHVSAGSVKVLNPQGLKVHIDR